MMQASNMFGIPPYNHPQLHQHHHDLFQTIPTSQFLLPQRDLLTSMQNHAPLHHHDFMIENHQDLRIHIKQVWHENLEHEFNNIDYLLHMPDSDPKSRCFLASIDTEYPGVESTLDKGRLHDPLYIYEQMKNNVDATNIIQVGLTLANRHGHLFTWEFNFNDFDIETDVQNSASIEFLNSHGVDFEKNKLRGIHSLDFAKRCMRSGLLGKNAPLTWISFQGGNDFGFLYKIFTRKKLPNDMGTFMEHINRVFGPSVFDIKHMIKIIDAKIYGGLDNVARTLGVMRTAGESHTAGSDSLLTMRTFIQLLSKVLKPTSSDPGLAETLRKFTMNMSNMNKRSLRDPMTYFESLISEEEESQKENHRNLTRYHGLKGLGFVNSFVSV